MLRRNIILEDASSRVSPNLDKLLTSFSGKHKAAMREAVIQVSNQALMAANVNIEQRRALVSGCSTSLTSLLGSWSVQKQPTLPRP